MSCSLMLHKSGMKIPDIVFTTNFNQKTVYRIVKCFIEIGGTVHHPVMVKIPENIHNTTEFNVIWYI